MSDTTISPVPTPVSPKVKYGAVAGVVAAVVVAVLVALMADPDGLGFPLPPWLTFLLMAAAPVLVQSLTAYQKRDPLRDLGVGVMVEEATASHVEVGGVRMTEEQWNAARMPLLDELARAERSTTGRYEAVEEPRSDGTWPR